MSTRSEMLQTQTQECGHKSEHWEDAGNMFDRSNPEYWEARRAFLSSYQFSEENEGLKEKMKRFMRGLNRSATQVVESVRKEMSGRRIGIRVLKIRLGMASVFDLSVRCFAPWLISKKRFEH